MIINNDCLIALKELPENSIDAIVTDPPYGLSFMGKKWDYDVPSVEIWAECLRVLKPGGYLLAFAGTRTYHRMACAIEDAGFEVRDMIEWVYGSGFPKSRNIGLDVDKRNGVTKNRGKAFVVAGQSGQRDKDTGGDLVTGSNTMGAYVAQNEWSGWGTALKPAHEPICMARKPLAEKTVAENVLKYGTGGINIDGSRVEGEPTPINKLENWSGFGQEKRPDYVQEMNTQGRFPANLIHDGSDEVLGLFPETKHGGSNYAKGTRNNWLGENKIDYTSTVKDSGSAARFFYCAKAPASQRYTYLTCNCQTVKLDSWQKQDQNQVEKTDGISQEVDTLENSTTEDLDFNTTLSGNNTMDQSHQNTTSTTLTETNSTTTSQTSNLLHQQNTSESMEDVNLEKENGGSHANSAHNTNQSQQNSGISQEKAGHSMGVAVPATLAKLYMKSVCGDCGTQVRSNGHPTQKPIALMEYLVKLVSKEGHTVLDPFLGSGTTGIACKNLNRNCIGIERDSEYVKIAEARINAV